ncbi:hypothetical protein P7K49_024026 [Saguinus oedipus]|uniref:Uncharacterized protein n=1 Tax=Saguinus oedipus TaxID=9490 RepID=A0ABQ9UP49_SAGOE|nr:hypothetical protein P7K49_024026 [Saguinus oedipus]
MHNCLLEDDKRTDIDSYLNEDQLQASGIQNCHSKMAPGIVQNCGALINFTKNKLKLFAVRDEL